MNRLALLVSVGRALVGAAVSRIGAQAARLPVWLAGARGFERGGSGRLALRSCRGARRILWLRSGATAGESESSECDEDVAHDCLLDREPTRGRRDWSGLAPYGRNYGGMVST